MIDKTLAIILGASEWPRMQALEGAKAFKISAKSFRQYLLSEKGMKLDSHDILDLFDTDMTHLEVDRTIQEFLRTKMSGKDCGFHNLIIYYTGHGDFTQRHQEFQLLLRATNDAQRESSGYCMWQLADAVDKHARRLCKYVFLDCCYAAAAFKDWQMQSHESLQSKIQQETEARFSGASGTILLCACDEDQWALYKPNESLTVFSSALIQTLARGIEEADEYITIKGLCDSMRDLIRAEGRRESVLPVLHVPKGIAEDLVNAPLFPNVRSRPGVFVSFWNLENLFAPEDHAGRPKKIASRVASDLEGWDSDLLGCKLNQLSSIITQMNRGNGPDLMGVCEAENLFVLGELSAILNKELPKRHYEVAHIEVESGRLLDTGLLYDRNVFTNDPAELSAFSVMPRTRKNEIAQATLVTNSGRELVVIVNHWPTRSGGKHETDPFRKTAGEYLRYSLQETVEAKGMDVPIIIMGDFNDEPFDESLRHRAGSSRFLESVLRAKTSVRLYNLAWNYMRQPTVDRDEQVQWLYGTMVHNAPHLFDQILVSKGLLLPDCCLRVREKTARIEAFPEMVGPNGAPIRFGLPKGNVERNVNTGGYSDHYPVSVELEEVI